MPQDELDINKIAAEFLLGIVRAVLKAAGKKLTFHDHRSAREYAKNVVTRQGSVRVMGMKDPLPLDDIYIKINLLEKLRSYTGLSSKELEDWEKYYKDERRITHERLDAMEVVKTHSHLLLLGQPGSGKTTFLKYLTLQALKGNLEPKRLPVFIILKDWAESEYEDLLDFMGHEFKICGFPMAEPFIENMLKQGKCLLLMDGLDEAIGSSRFDKMQSQIRDFADKHDKNQFVISCRVAAYNHYFRRFSDAELADFDDDQSANFIHRWFGDERRSKGQQCLAYLKQEKNAPIRELTRNPLLLSLLCLAFDRTEEFPSNRIELYRDGLDALLGEWDETKKIKRQEVYKRLTKMNKEKLFSYLAWTWFEADRYFVRQQEAEERIGAFIYNLPGVSEKSLLPDSKAVLKAIEAHHGILVEQAHNVYSFAHLSFQEYYTARYIVENNDKGTFQGLLEHLTDRRWRVVFLLCAEMGFDVESR